MAAPISARASTSASTKLLKRSDRKLGAKRCNASMSFLSAATLQSKAGLPLISML